MRRLMLAAAFVTAWAGLARAEDSVDAVAEVFGEATALGELCPTLKISKAALVFYAAALDVPVDDGLISEAGFYQRKAAAQWKGKRTFLVCAEADRLYGYDGTKAPNLLTPE